MKPQIELPQGYKPSEDEPFMNDLQKQYFHQKLLAWKASLLDEGKTTIHILQEASVSQPDLTDRASIENDHTHELRIRDRERKLIAKINAAITRIENGTYGYCEETGEPIGLRRLEARPIATLSIEAQEMHERQEKIHRDS